MRKKLIYLIYLISFVVVLSLASITYGDGPMIGGGFMISDFNNTGDPCDGWAICDTNDWAHGGKMQRDPNITALPIKMGGPLDGNCLKIIDTTINDSVGGERTINYSFYAHKDVNEFRNNRKISLDLMRVVGSPWTYAAGGWSECHMIIDTGKQVAISAASRS